MLARPKQQSGQVLVLQVHSGAPVFFNELVPETWIWANLPQQTRRIHSLRRSQNCHLQSAGCGRAPTIRFLHSSPRITLAASLTSLPVASPPHQLQEGSWLVEALTHDEVKRVPCISSGIHFPSPAGDSLIAFQTAIMSSLPYSFLLKMITISHYFSNKNSTSLPLCKERTVDFNSTSCLYPACISVLYPLLCSCQPV